MAVVLDALAPYVKKLITDMAEEEVHVLLGVSGEIKKLEGNMEILKDVLADAERRRITEQTVQGWVGKLKDAMYDATDILDLCQLEADKRRESNCGSMEKKVPGCLKPLLFCLWNPVFAHKIGSRIKELNQRLDDIHNESAKFNFITNLGSMKPTNAELHSSAQKMTSEFNESAILGEKLEKDTKELVQVLITDDNHTIKVVSIVGMGGMGKTTLAQKIFRETTIQEHFKMKIWLSITQHFDDADLLRTAIKHAGRNHGGEQDKSLLTRTLTDILSKDRFLLVMDDVWSENAWNNVLSVPIMNASHNQPGSRVLITTRKEDLAQRMGASFHQHHVSPLDEEDAWSLLKKQLPPPSDQVDQLKDVGMKIIRKCGGLPLAIKVMGGMLSTKYQSEREWVAVLNNPAWSVTGLPEELDNRLYLSYEDLSPQLKQCFLYCSLFPKGTFIRNGVVIPMWISEGFIQPQPQDDDRLEEVATECYRELITRNLIEPTPRASSTGYECTMHDVVRSFAEFMAREESLVVVQDEQAAAIGGSSHSLVRRLSIGSTISVQEWGILQKQKSVRTLLINCRINIKPGDSLSSLSSLRVLSISGADCDRLVDSLCQLRHLRYLYMKNTDISRLPDDIYRMKFLQHITTAHCKNLDHIPRGIIQLVHLRTVNIIGSNVKVVPKGLGGLTNLRLLFGFPVHMDMDMDGGSWCSLEEIAPLSQLRYLTLHGLENVSPGLLAEKATISSKGRLSYLRLHCSSDKYMGSTDEIEKQQQQRAIEEVFDSLCPPSCIENLGMKGGYFGRWLPNWMMAPATTAFKSLRYLQLEDLPCCTHLPSGLCQLPSLDVLIIKSAPAIESVGPEFQAFTSLAMGEGGVINATSAAFPKLRNLALSGLSEWKEWVWEDVTADAMAMPALEIIMIHNCKLSHLPPGLANGKKRHALRELYLYSFINLTYVENFPSVVDLDVFDCPKLKRISGLSRLQKIRIVRCPNLEVLEGVPALDSMGLQDHTMETLPGYLRGVNPRYLDLGCGKKLCESILSPGSSSEWDKISHIRTRNIDYNRRKTLKRKMVKVTTRKRKIHMN